MNAPGRLLIFNPSHDMALAAHSACYTPPRAIAEMERRMSDFPGRWAREGDVVLTDWRVPYAQLVRQAGHPLIPEPWGWNIPLRRRLLRLGVPAELVPTEEELERWRNYSSRRFAATYLHELLPLLPTARTAGREMAFFDSAEDFVRQAEPGTYMLKPEFSSSGRGHRLITLPEEAGSLRMHHFLADRFLRDKLLDAALLYYIDGEGRVQLLGYSVFHTNARGGYLRQEQLPQGLLRDVIVQAMADAADMDALISAHSQLLSHLLAPHYHGYVGIDMLVARGVHGQPVLHPCLELNLRMTMGIAWLMQCERGSAGDSIFFAPRL